MRALVVGAGLTGLTAAWMIRKFLPSADIHVWEAAPWAGGTLATGSIAGVLYEMHGAHISHTASETAIDFFQQVADWVPYVHIVKTQIPPGLVSWPPQVGELREFREWGEIDRQLRARPSEPRSTDFESYCIDLMGETLYQWFIYGYTKKQWGMEPRELASSFAPKRIDLRSDGYLPLFRDKWQGWPVGGWSRLIDAIIDQARPQLRLGAHVTEKDVDWAKWDAVVVTAPLDDFLEVPRLPWRGVRFEHVWRPEIAGVHLPAGVVNYPAEDVPHTRVIETKWMSGQRDSERGTVLSYEFPGSEDRHYPIDDVLGLNRKRAAELKSILQSRHPQAITAGRLANYVYIDTDQAVTQGLHAGSKALSRS